MREAKMWIKKARASWWEDGIVEIVVGVALLIIGLAGFLSNHLTGGAGVMLRVVWMLSLFVFVVFGRRIVKAFKTRFVWPKYGYAEPLDRREGRGGLLWSTVIIVSLVLSIVFYRKPVANFLISIIPAGVFIYISQFSGLKRFVFIAVLTLLTGIVLTILEVNFSDSVGIILVASGIFLLISGLIAWEKFKREMEG